MHIPFQKTFDYILIDSGLSNWEELYIEYDLNSDIDDVDGILEDSDDDYEQLVKNKMKNAKFRLKYYFKFFIIINNFYYPVF